MESKPRQSNAAATPYRILANMTIFTLDNAAATHQLGREIGAQLAPGDTVWLSGPLGAGKTTFAQGVAESLGIEEPITSPTFVLMNEYPGAVTLLHLDAYRLEGLDYDGLRDAGLEDFLSRDDAVRLIEWPQMVAKWLPEPHFRVEFEIEGEARAVQVEERL